MPGRPDLGQQQQSNESQTSPVDEDARKSLLYYVQFQY